LLSRRTRRDLRGDRQAQQQDARRRSRRRTRDGNNAASSEPQTPALADSRAREVVSDDIAHVLRSGGMGEDDTTRPL
jgi:hypothetical protein